MYHFNAETIDDIDKNPDTGALIPDLRDAIDHIDQKLLELINQRLELAVRIGKIKAQSGTQVAVNLREIEILERLKHENRGPLKPGMIEEIFSRIIASSKDLQRDLRISFPGPEATFTHLAAVSHFTRSFTFFPQQNIPDVFQEVQKGICAYGVVPVENSLEGYISHTLDMFFDSPLKICGETYQAITYDLLSKSPDFGNIRTVFSDPRALKRCGKWLRKHLGHARIVECASVLHAAKKAAHDETSAAIGNSEAARIHELEIRASRIEDTSRNTTRFLIIGRDVPEPAGDDKTSIMFVTSHVPGALHKALAPMAKNEVNMVKLESRPAAHQNWSYVFFADLLGHIKDRPVKQTFNEMKESCLFLKWLGSYPKASFEEGGVS